MIYHWKDMAACSGAAPMALTTRRFQTCSNPVSEKSPPLIPLCTAHLDEVTFDIITPIKEQIIAAAKALGDAYDRGVRDERQRLNAMREKQEAVQSERRAKASRVYFMRCAKFVKIGFSTNVHMRLDTIRKSGGVLMPEGLPYWTTEIAAVIPAGMDHEKELHAKFSHLRHTGEWFTEAPELTEYIERMEIAA